MFFVSVIAHLSRLELKLELVRNQGDEFGISRLAFRVADSISKESLQSIQVASVPGDFDGVADSTLHSGRGGLECLGHLGIENLRDGVRVPDGPRRGYHGGAWEPYKE